MPVLDVITPNQPPHQVVLTEDSMTIGRDPVCGVYLDDAGASRRHARVSRAKSGRYVLEDLASKNGTQVNGKEIRSWELEDDDEVFIGNSQLQFHSETPPPQSSVTMVPEERNGTTTSYSPAEVKPQLSAMRLNLLYSLSERLTRLRNREVLLHDVMDICVDTFGFDRSVIALVENDPDNPVWAYQYDRMGGEQDLVISQSLLRRVLHDGHRVILRDPLSDAGDPTRSMVQAGIRSAMCAPIRFQERIHGAIYGDRITTAREYTQEEVDFLSAIATQLSVGLANARLLESEARKVRMEGELRLAREIQRGLFPNNLPKGDCLGVAAINEPGLEVSGDYYDVITLSPARVVMVIGDVTGKGVAAAMLMANLQSAVRLSEVGNAPLDELVAQWNGLICQNTTDSRFITMVALVLDAEARKVAFCNAGHLPPALIGPDGLRYLGKPSGLPLGVEPDESFAVGQVDLPPGPHSLLLYTDGVTEVMNEATEQFGEARLTETLANGTWSNADELIDLVGRKVAAFRGTAGRGDDLTMVAAYLPK